MIKIFWCILLIFVIVFTIGYIIYSILNRYFRWDDVYYREFVYELNKPKGVKIMHSENMFYKKISHIDILDKMALFIIEHENCKVEGPYENDIFVVKCDFKTYNSLSNTEKNLYFVYYYVED